MKHKQKSKPKKNNQSRQHKAPVRAKLTRVRSARLVSRTGLQVKHRHLLEFENHQHHDLMLLKSPSPATLTVARRIVSGRNVMYAGSANLGLFALNPFYAIQSPYVHRTTVGGERLYPVYYSSSSATMNQGSAMQPYSALDTLGNGWQSGYATNGAVSVSDMQGNIVGLRRWVAARITVSYLGRVFDAGGEIYCVNDPENGPFLSHANFGQVMSRRTVRRAPAPVPGKSVTFNFTPQTADEQTFQHSPQWLTMDHNPSGGTDPACDPTVFGGYCPNNSFLPFGPAYASKGWNIGIGIVSASINQPFEVFWEVLVEGEFKSFSTVTSPVPMFAMPTDHVVPADPVGAGFISTVRAAQCLESTNGKAGSSTPGFWKTVSSIANAIEGVATNPGVQMIAGSALKLLN